MLRRLTAADGPAATAAALLSGGALALTLPKPGFCFLAWFALTPLLALAENVRPRRAAELGLAFGFGFSLVAVQWIYSTCRFAGVPIVVAAGALTGLALILSLQWALWALAGGLVARGAPRWLAPAAWALLLAAIEEAFGYLPWGFVRLAYSQWRHLPLLQGISIFGLSALTFLIAYVNASLVAAARRRFANAAVAAVLLLGWSLYGERSLRAAQDPAASAAPVVAILQPNVDQYEKWDERSADRIRRNITGLVFQAARSSPKPQLVVWPESSVPGWLEDPENSRWVQKLAIESGIVQVVGAITRDEMGQHNSAVVIDRTGRRAQAYHKRQLVPFGEFVPFRRVLEPWIGILAQMGDFSPGRGQQPLMTSIGPAAVTICFEAMFPRLASTNWRLILNLTNDGWYKETWGPYQHFWANRYRAIENRAWVIRAANTGISGVFDPWGRVAARLDLSGRGVIAAALAPRSAGGL